MPLAFLGGFVHEVRLLFASNLGLMREELVEELNLRQLPAEIIGHERRLVRELLHTCTVRARRLYGGNSCIHRTSPKQVIN